MWMGCKKTAVESSTNSDESIPKGAFSYTSYDTNGTAIVSGWFTMNLSNLDSISGEWHFKQLGNAQNIGPQTGDGTLIGGTSNGRVWIELNPQFRDNNLQLTGTLETNKYFGQWIWISFAGITNRGIFEAIKNN
jgi:hypothetical protein